MSFWYSYLAPERVCGLTRLSSYADSTPPEFPSRDPESCLSEVWPGMSTRHVEHSQYKGNRGSQRGGHFTSQLEILDGPGKWESKVWDPKTEEMFSQPPKPFGGHRNVHFTTGSRCSTYVCPSTTPVSTHTFQPRLTIKSLLSSWYTNRLLLLRYPCLTFTVHSVLGCLSCYRSVYQEGSTRV